MGKSSAEMSVSPRVSEVRTKICQVRSSQSLRVPNRRLCVQIQDRPRSADVSKRDDSLTRNISEINNRRSGSFSTRSRPGRNTCSRQESNTCTNNNFLQVPEIVVRRPSTDDPDSDRGSCSSKDRTPSPFGIERERLPPGSPTFRRAMVELLSESDFSGDDNSNSDDNIAGKDVNKTAKKGQKGQNKSTQSKPKSSSAYRVVRHGKRVNIVRNSKR